MFIPFQGIDEAYDVQVITLAVGLHEDWRETDRFRILGFVLYLSEFHPVFGGDFSHLVRNDGFMRGEALAVELVDLLLRQRDFFVQSAQRLDLPGLLP